MAVASDIIAAALREIGILAAGETPSADDATDGLVSLNRLLDQFAAERLQIFTTTRTTWTIAASDGSYTIGSTGDVVVSRPVFIDHVNFLDTSTDPDSEYPLSRLTEDAYAGIVAKALTSTYPDSYYYNPTYPLGALTLFPTPTSATLTGVLYAPAAVAQFAALTTSVSLPPGYERMLVKNLAVDMLPSYERQPDPLLVTQAREATAVVKRANRRLMDLSFDPGALIGSPAGGRYNIYRN